MKCCLCGRRVNAKGPSRTLFLVNWHLVTCPLPSDCMEQVTEQLRVVVEPLLARQEGRPALPVVVEGT